MKPTDIIAIVAGATTGTLSPASDSDLKSAAISFFAAVVVYLIKALKDRIQK